MNPTASRTVIAKTIPWGWSFVFYLLTVIAALALAAPYAHAVTLSASISGTPTPGATLTATGMYTLGAGESFVSSEWSQVEGAPVAIANPNNTTTNVTLGSASAYAAYLVEVLKTPPITAADLPPDLKLQPINEINKGLQDTTQVVAITPMADEKLETVVLRFSVITNPGMVETTQDVTVTTEELPWVINPGVRTVPLSDAFESEDPDLTVPVSNHAVLLIAKCGEEPVLDSNNEPTGEYVCTGQTTFSWEMTSKPGGSTATLTDPLTRTPWFVPDKTGIYDLKETVSGDTLEVYAGTYHGVIDPLLTAENVVNGGGNYNGDGRPEPDPDCTVCHYPGGAAPANFDTWRLTGHAEAFFLNLETSTHFGENCFSCHTVGFDRGAAGFNDHLDYNGINPPNPVFHPNFLDDLLPDPASMQKWVDMLLDYPDLARVSNIQCENCHGPQNYSGHPYDVDSRVSLKSEVCGSCHGEPLRHGRFQQWQLSSHATTTSRASAGRPRTKAPRLQTAGAAIRATGLFNGARPRSSARTPPSIRTTCST